MLDPDNNEDKTDVNDADKSLPDEDAQLFVYGNITIRDVESGDVLVNQSF